MMRKSFVLYAARARCVIEACKPCLLRKLALWKGRDILHAGWNGKPYGRVYGSDLRPGKGSSTVNIEQRYAFQARAHLSHLGGSRRSSRSLGAHSNRGSGRVYRDTSRKAWQTSEVVTSASCSHASQIPSLRQCQRVSRRMELAK